MCDSISSMVSAIAAASASIDYLLEFVGLTAGLFMSVLYFFSTSCLASECAFALSMAKEACAMKPFMFEPPFSAPVPVEVSLDCTLL